jgi:transglutaminase-like putative cysteine protease
VNTPSTPAGSDEATGYASAQERVVVWRRSVLERMGQREDPAAPSSTHRGFASGIRARVDSVLSTRNTSNVSDVYFDVLDCEAGRFRLGAIPFVSESMAHPTLIELRSRFDLDAVAGGGSDLERVRALRAWIRSQFAHRMPYRMPPWDALLILERGSRGVDAFICMHTAVVLVQCCRALGMQARVVNLHQGVVAGMLFPPAADSNVHVLEHVVTEVWLAEWSKWVAIDADHDCHYEIDGVPLSAWEIHNEVVADGPDRMTCVRGPNSSAFDAFGAPVTEGVDDWFQSTLPSFYAHVSVVMRSTFLSDPTGPTAVAHLTDARTPPILWYDGWDMRLNPYLLGPICVAQPFTPTTGVPTDGNFETAWASEDHHRPHWIELELAQARPISRVVLHWPEYDGRYQTARQIVLSVRSEGRWIVLDDIDRDVEAPLTACRFEAVCADAIRIVQAAAGGSTAYPNRMWLSQIEVFGPDSAGRAIAEKTTGVAL